MEKRIARFIAGLRASGVRISVAESQDAWKAVEHLGVGQREDFRMSLRATLIKDINDVHIFEELFPMYFGKGAPPILNPEAELTPEQQQMLQDAIRDLALDMQALMDWLMRGQAPSQDEMDRLMEQSGMQYANSPYQSEWYTRRMQRLLGWDRLDDMLDAIYEYLAQQGMDPQTLAQLRQQVEENRGNVEEQLNQMVGETIQDNMVEDYQRRQENAYDLMERPFERLSETEIDVLREQVRRL
ncbi:MAG: hypothetical protein GYB64_08080, partial [Chloroflexi bacterium]|nr:hypothetical protein [Chloroflexota bacterium]